MKKYLLHCLTCLFSVTSFGQTFITSSNQKLVEDAVKDGIILVRQFYQLKDTTVHPVQYYGRNNQPDFGMSLNLGILFGNGYLSGAKTFRPWMQDSNYVEFENSKYVPVLSKTEFRTFGNCRFDSLRISNEIIPLQEGRIFMPKDSLFSNKGFTANKNIGKQECWLVWITSAEEARNESDSLQLALTTYRMDITIEIGHNIYDIPSPPFKKNIIGGFLVSPVVTAIGNISFQLVALLEKKQDEWQAILIKPLSAEAPAIKRSQPEQSLTPSTRPVHTKDNKKRKKDDKSIQNGRQNQCGNGEDQQRR